MTPNKSSVCTPLWSPASVWWPWTLKYEWMGKGRSGIPSRLEQSADPRDTVAPLLDLHHLPAHLWAPWASPSRQWPGRVEVLRRAVSVWSSLLMETGRCPGFIRPSKRKKVKQGAWAEKEIEWGEMKEMVERIRRISFRRRSRTPENGDIWRGVCKGQKAGSLSEELSLPFLITAFTHRQTPSLLPFTHSHLGPIALSLCLPLSPPLSFSLLSPSSLSPFSPLSSLSLSLFPSPSSLCLCLPPPCLSSLPPSLLPPSLSLTRRQSELSSWQPQTYSTDCIQRGNLQTKLHRKLFVLVQKMKLKRRKEKKKRRKKKKTKKKEKKKKHPVREGRKSRAF